MKERIEVVKAMHTLATHFNDEDGYMWWVSGGVPDCPSEDDFEWFAEDDDNFESLVGLFYKVFKEYGNDLY